MRPPRLSRWLLLVALAICLPDRAPASETGNLEQLRDHALELVNKDRRERGLDRLSHGSALNTAAQTHAQDMVQRDYYAHASPEGDTVMDRYMDAGGSRWRLTAENIARCRGCLTPPTAERIESLHQGWMNSPTHRENILRRGLDRFGFGIAVGSDQTLYAVQTFAGPGTPRDAQPGDEAHAIEPARQTGLALQRINKERRTKNLEPLKADDALIRAASNLIPEKELKSTPDLEESLATALPEDASRDWRSFSAIAGRCGGCGPEPVPADVRFFVQQWLDHPDYRLRLLSKEPTHFGLVIRSNGDGLKAAAAVMGRHR